MHPMEFYSYWTTRVPFLTLWYYLENFTRKPMENWSYVTWWDVMFLVHSSRQLNLCVDETAGSYGSNLLAGCCESWWWFCNDVGVFCWGFQGCQSCDWHKSCFRLFPPLSGVLSFQEVIISSIEILQFPIELR